MVLDEVCTIFPVSPVGPPVLLVDDDSGVRRTLARFLGRDGMSVVEADNGQQALTYLQGGGAASVIVLDLRMPVMDGFTFRQMQRKDSLLAGIPVIVLSGADIDRFDELQAAATFEKPASFSDVAKCVRELASQS
jgi:chemotaxis family two-component system sensor histidine kinase/response regulator PixL